MDVFIIYFRMADSQLTQITPFQEKWLELLEKKDIQSLIEKYGPSDVTLIPRILSLLSAGEVIKVCKKYVTSQKKLNDLVDVHEPMKTRLSTVEYDLDTSKKETQLEKIEVGRLQGHVELLQRRIQGLDGQLVEANLRMKGQT
jgi:DNA-binding transcriptional MerR regulator